MTAASAMTPATRVQLQPPRLAVLATHLAKADAASQWDFVSITLDVLLDTYRLELEDARAETASTPQRRAKLARWQRATQELMDQLQVRRVRLLEGAPFALHVDPQQQILIVIDGQPIAVTAPRPVAERAIEQQVLAQFCAYNDCSVLDAAQLPAADEQVRSGVVWSISQHAAPVVEINGLLRCAFRDIAQRERKARLCRRLAGEVAELRQALDQARAKGQPIDWPRIADSAPYPGTDLQLVLNANGAWLRLQLPLLTQLDSDDWHDLVSGLEPRAQSQGEPPTLSRLDRLLKEHVAD